MLDVCRRYVHAYGPARPGDFRQWFSARAFDAPGVRALFDSLGDELEEVGVDGRRAYVLAGDTAFPAPRPSVRLLPEYDVYIMGFREREHLVPEPVKAQVAAHGKGRYEGPAGTPFLVIDGVCAGIWKRKKSAKRIELTVEPARTLTSAEREGVEAEAERIGAFLGLEPALTLAT